MVNLSEPEDFAALQEDDEVTSAGYEALRATTNTERQILLGKNPDDFLNINDFFSQYKDGYEEDRFDVSPNNLGKRMGVGFYKAVEELLEGGPVELVACDGPLEGERRFVERPDEATDGISSYLKSVGHQEIAEGVYEAGHKINNFDVYE